MSLRVTTVHENARIPLECSGSTPPWNGNEDDEISGVEPPQLSPSNALGMRNDANRPERHGAPGPRKTL